MKSVCSMRVCVALALGGMLASANATVIYDAGSGPVGADILGFSGWSGPTGTGISTNEYGGINDGGTPAYMIMDTTENDDGDATGNGPTFAYNHSAMGIDFATDLWKAGINTKVIAGSGGNDNAFSLHDGQGQRYLSWIYEDGNGDIIFRDHGGGNNYNLGANDDAYHDFAMERLDASTVGLFFDGSQIGAITSMSGTSDYELRVGSGSSSARGGLYVTNIEMAIPEPATIGMLSLAGVAILFFRRRLFL